MKTVITELKNENENERIESNMPRTLRLRLTHEPVGRKRADLSHVIRLDSLSLHPTHVSVTRHQTIE